MVDSRHERATYTYEVVDIDPNILHRLNTKLEERGHLIETANEDDITPFHLTWIKSFQPFIEEIDPEGEIDTWSSNHSESLVKSWHHAQFGGNYSIAEKESLSTKYVDSMIFSAHLAVLLGLQHGKAKVVKTKKIVPEVSTDDDNGYFSVENVNKSINRVFISYARTDREFALKLANDLRSAVIPIWIDSLDIRTGDTWDRAVQDALNDCVGLLVVLSPAAVASRSVMDEVSFALDEQKKIFPVIHQTCDLPFRLRRVQFTDLTPDYAGGLAELVKALGGERQPEALEGRFAQTHSWLSRMRSPMSKVAIRTGIAGTLFTIIFQVANYVDDPRIRPGAGGMIRSGVLISMLVAGLGWAVAGAVAGPRRLPLSLAAGTALTVLASWIAVYGTYADTMGAAVIIGAPVGAIVGAAVGRVILKMRRGS